MAKRETTKIRMPGELDLCREVERQARRNRLVWRAVASEVRTNAWLARQALAVADAAMAPAVITLESRDHLRVTRWVPTGAEAARRRDMGSVEGWMVVAIEPATGARRAA